MVCLTNGVHNFAFQLQAIDARLRIDAQYQLSHITGLNIRDCERSYDQDPADRFCAVLTVENARNILLEAVD